MKVHTYLNLPGKCAEALAFYEKHLGAKILTKGTFAEMSATGAPHNLPPGFDPSSIIHARFMLGDTTLMASDGPPDRVQPMRSAYISLWTRIRKQRGFTRLSARAGRFLCPCRRRFSPIGSASSAINLASTGWSSTRSRWEPAEQAHRSGRPSPEKS